MDVLIPQAQKEGMKAFMLLPSLVAVNLVLGAEPTIRIRLVDDSNLDVRTREMLTSKAAEILARAAVASTWLDCPSKPQSEMPAGCVAPITAMDFVIRILPRAMIGHDNGLGSSVAGPEGGVYGLIYHPSVEEISKVVQAPVSVMLALATVHEVGHLILGNNAHWPAGIMHPRWDRKQVADTLEMNHYFNQRQSRELRQRLAVRAAVTRGGLPTSAPPATIAVPR